MLYCSSSIVLSSNVDLHHTISLLAKEQFNAITAHQLALNEYNIDAGLNDIRAVVNSEANLIRFCCRSESDVVRFNERVLDFTQKHPDLCRLATSK
jgi:hypothetical protein